MKHIDEFRSAALAKALVKQLQRTVTRPIKVIEVCGTHTMSIFRTGIREIIPQEYCLISGPGCPVCVTTQEYIDEAVSLAQRPDVILCTFGDMLRVPGSHTSLLREKSLGHDVRVLYSPLDAVDIAVKNPDKQVVFLGIGFETTAPIVGLTILDAAKRGISNYSVFSAHKLVPPAIEMLAGDAELQLDGFLCPGHVSTIIGLQPYRFLTERYSLPAVISGFEITDILHGLLLLADMIRKGKPEAVNAYTRAVDDKGNPKALEIVDQVFTTIDSTWRGIGVIPQSGLMIRPEFERFDAALLFELSGDNHFIPSGCICGDILRGRKTPLECELYKNGCTPENPIGACMVSAEGTCAAYYKYYNQ